MPGEPTPPRPDRQHTLQAPINCVGIGLHTGRRVNLVLRPAAPDHGIVFRRSDLGRDIPARFDRVVDTRLCTALAHEKWASARVGTVEHLLAALGGLGVDNALVEVDGPEVPALDGSAAQFVTLLDAADIVAQPAPRRRITIRRTVRVTDGEAFAELHPGDGDGLSLAGSIDFADPAIGRQALALHLTPEAFRRELASARTFTLLRDVEHLRAAGLAQGGSLANAVVVDAGRVMNPEGLRAPDEFVRHKLLDAVGDLALAGAPIDGRFVGHRSGHTLHNRLLRALFADTAAWRMAEAEAVQAAA